jgi:GNAT superfamily N-acetyltransferase
MQNNDRAAYQPVLASRPARRTGTPLLFRSFRSTDQGDIVTLLSRGRPAGYLDIKSAIFDWQFHRNPHSDGRSSFLVGTPNDGTSDGTIVALNGFMPARIRFHHQPMLASWSCDTYVSPAHRGQGIGKELIKLVSNAAPLMLGYGISDMSDPIFHAYDWQLHPHVVVLFYHIAEGGIAGHLKNFGSKLARRTHEHRPSYARELGCEDHTPFSAEVDELWEASRSGYASVVERDSAYLNWKYHEHPLHRYITYSARFHGRLQGLMIARHDPEESVIVDYCGPAKDADLMSELAGAAVADLARRKTLRVRCETTHLPLIDALHRAGFLSSRHGSRFRVRSNLPTSDVLSGWFLMTGDSDNDMMSGTAAASSRT